MQIYKCKLNTYIDNNGNLRNKIDYVHLKKYQIKKNMSTVMNQTI